MKTKKLVLGVCALALVTVTPKVFCSLPGQQADTTRQIAVIDHVGNGFKADPERLKKMCVEEKCIIDDALKYGVQAIKLRKEAYKLENEAYNRIRYLLYSIETETKRKITGKFFEKRQAIARIKELELEFKKAVEDAEITKGLCDYNKAVAGTYAEAEQAHLELARKERAKRYAYLSELHEAVVRERETREGIDMERAQKLYAAEDIEGLEALAEEARLGWFYEEQERDGLESELSCDDYIRCEAENAFAHDFVYSTKKDKHIRVQAYCYAPTTTQEQEVEQRVIKFYKDSHGFNGYKPSDYDTLKKYISGAVENLKTSGDKTWSDKRKMWVTNAKCG
jgi:hypothetical protein